MKGFLTILFAISLALFIVNCGDDKKSTCDEACGILNDLCGGGFDMGECKEGCQEVIAEMPQETIDAMMVCLKAATTASAAGICVGEENVCD